MAKQSHKADKAKIRQVEAKYGLPELHGGDRRKIWKARAVRAYTLVELNKQYYAVVSKCSERFRAYAEDRIDGDAYASLALEAEAKKMRISSLMQRIPCVREAWVFDDGAGPGRLYNNLSRY